MRAWQIEGSFGLDSLKLAEAPSPAVKSGEARVRIRATSLNYRDLMTVRGHYNPRQPLPLIPLSDGVGEVVEVGPDVTRVKVGDRVCGAFLQSWIDGAPDKRKSRSSLGGPISGMLAEEVVLSQEGLVHPPAHLTDEEAATLPCAAVTAWHAIVETGFTKPGDTVLLQGTGGVALFALQFAKAMGARALIVSSSDEKLQRAKDLGADEGLNYRTTPDWGEWARKQTGGEGVDHVIELGGAGTLERSLRAVRTGGGVSMIGVLEGVDGKLNVAQILMQCVCVQGIYVGSRTMFERMNRSIELSKLRPVIDKTFAFEEAPAAFRHLESGKHFGKICIRVTEP